MADIDLIRELGDVMLYDVKDIHQLGEAIDRYLNRHEKEKFAREVVRFVGDPEKIYQEVIECYIEDHSLGEPSVINVAGVLFYWCDVSPPTTLRDLHDLLVKVSPRTRRYFMGLLPDAAGLSTSHSKTYQDAIKRGGKIPVRITNFIPYGETESGKSSLCDALQGIPHKDDKPSTRVADFTNALCLVDDFNSPWSKAKEREVKAAIMCLVAERRREGAATSTTTAPPTTTPSQGTEEGTSAAMVHQNPDADSKEAESENESLINEIVELVTSPTYIKAALTNSRKDWTFRIIRICDLAGQDAYKTLQDGIMPKMASAYAIVYVAAKPIQSPHIGVEGQTSLDYIMDCISTIYDSADMEKCVMYVVGTKIDRRLETSEDPVVQRTIAKVQGELEEDRKKLRERLTTPRYSELVKKERILFFVDNTRKSGLFPTSHAELCREISKVNATHLEVPVVWLPFTVAIMELSEKLKTPWLPWMDVRNLAYRLRCIQADKELVGLLEYQHGIGFVIYGNVGSPVIVNVDLFMRCVAELILPKGLAVWYEKLHSESFELTDDDDRWYNHGMLTTRVARELLCNSEVPDVKELMGSEENCEEIFLQMKELKVLRDIGMQTKLGKDNFMLLPCVSRRKDISCTPSSDGGPFCLVRPLRQCFPLSKFSKVALQCLERFQAVSGDTLDQIHMGKTAFRIPWAKYDDGTWMNIILRYITCGITLEVEKSQRSDGFLKFCSSKALEVVKFVRCSMVQFLGPNRRVEPAVICQCQHKCREHQHASCKDRDCMHFLKLEKDRQPNCRYSSFQSVNKESLKFWLRMQQVGDRGPLEPLDSASQELESSPRKAAEPWRSPEFADCYPLLASCQEVAWIRWTCFLEGIITEETNYAVFKETHTSTAMKKLLRMVCQFSENFPRFREVLRSHENNAYAGILERLDAIGPDPEEFIRISQRLKSGRVAGERSTSEEVATTDAPAAPASTACAAPAPAAPASTACTAPAPAAPAPAAPASTACTAPAPTAPAAPAPTYDAAPAQRTEPVPAWSSQLIADISNKRKVGEKLGGYLTPDEKDTLTIEVVRLIDGMLADTAVSALNDYCIRNPDTGTGPTGPYNMTGVLYYIGQHKSDMTCQEFVDVVGIHANGKKRRVKHAFRKYAEFIKYEDRG